MTPNSPLADDEEVLISFCTDRATYTRTNAWMAVAAMAGGMGVLWLLGDPNIWAGAVGGLAAVAVRAFYLMSEALSMRWDLTNKRLLGPAGRSIRLQEIKTLKKFATVVQVITTTGDKHLLKYLADPTETIRRINAAQNGGRV